MAKVAVIGNTTWGTTLALLAVRAGSDAVVWTRSQQEADAINIEKMDLNALPGVSLPDGVSHTGSIEQALEGASVAILAVPSQDMRDNVKKVAGHLNDSMVVVSAAKGIEESSEKRMSQVIAEEIGSQFHDNICVLDGGTEGLGLMDAICGLHRLVVIDCIHGGREPGTVFCFDWDPTTAGPGRLGSGSSAHQTNLTDVLQRVALVCEPPRTTVVGVEPASLEMGLELSDPVAARLDALCDLALRQF